MDFKKYKPRLQEYLHSKGFDNFDMNISCPFHKDSNPSMKVYEDNAKCFSGCGLKDIYDFIGLFENFSKKADQFIFAQKYFGDTSEIYIKKESFKIDKKSFDILIKYIRELLEKEPDYLNYFAKKRGYGSDFANNFGFWPGYEIAEKALGKETLEKAGIPVPDENKKYSSWHRSGVVCRFEHGLKLMYIRKDKDTGKEITEKRGSHGSQTFPYPDLPSKSVILVEAEISALACRINGIPQATATGGTEGLSIEGIKRLLPLEEIIFMLDGDDAGRQACGLKSYDKIKNPKKLNYPEKLLKYGYKGIIKLVELPDNIDPDDMIKTKRIDELKKLIKKAKIFNSEIIPEKTEKTEKKPEDLDEPLNYSGLEKLFEESFFVRNALIADETRKDKDNVRRFLHVRNDLAFQEAARLYFMDVHKNGIKTIQDSNIETIWIYDQNKKYWLPKTADIGHEPMELFISRYGARWFCDGSHKAFLFKKNNQTRSEIERSFREIVKENIKPDHENFLTEQSSKRTISCKNCVLVWNYKDSKFDKKEHCASHGLTTAPFPYNKIDMNNLTDDQIKRKDLLLEYFMKLVSWNEDEPEKIVEFLLSYIGYTLTPWREKCFMIWIGSKDSGKSTLKEILKKIHGNKFAEADFSRWAKQKSPHDTEILPGKLVLADDDFEVGGRLPERELKTLSQNGTVMINPKHISQFSIMNTSTPLILTNGSPRAEDINIENRLYAVPFKSDFSRERRNIESEIFINKIMEHETLEILFNIAIDHAEKTIFAEGNFNKFMPRCVKEMSSSVIGTASSVLMWIDDMVAQGEINVDKSDRNLKIRRTDLYSLYKNMFSGQKKGLHAFYESVRQRFEEIKTSGMDYFYGIEKIYKNKDDVNYYEKQEDIKYDE